MQNVILVVHIIACVVMTIVIMLQKSEGGALGIGGGGGGLMTGRSAAGALVRVTMFFGGLFFLTSLGLTTLANRTADDRSVVERVTGGGEDGEQSLLEGLGLGGDTPLEGDEVVITDETVAFPIDEDQIAPALPDEPTEPVDNPQ